MIKPTKLIVSLATAVCALAACGARAQTNPVTFSATMTLQGPSTLTDGGTNTSYAAAKATPYSAADLIAELGLATGNEFSKKAKLELIGTGNSPEFAVSDDDNFVVISTNIISLNQIDSTFVISGTQNNNTGLSASTSKGLAILELDFNDIGVGNGNNLQFSMRGLFSATTMDTVPSPTTGDYTETTSAKVSSMTGDGTLGGTNLVVTGSMSSSGKASLVLPPPTT